MNVTFCKTFFQMDHNKSLKPSSKIFCVNTDAPRWINLVEWKGRFIVTTHLLIWVWGIMTFTFYQTPLSEVTYSNSYTEGGGCHARCVNQHIRSSWGFSILPKDTLTCRPGESNQRPSNKKTLALSLSHRDQYRSFKWEEKVVMCKKKKNS